MNDWIPIIFILLALVIIIGNFSTFEKSSKQKLRKKGLNDLKETLPRENRSKHKMSTINKKKHDH
jgi:hypothetical protein|tara:strand:+ start:925 stop:1119 length:195 start_codon:yes stop_codon:yes gene_type:complete